MVQNLLRRAICGCYKEGMEPDIFRTSLAREAPPDGLPIPVQALWWDAKGNWALAHKLVDSLETPDGMAVHAYLHRKEGEEWNADYWYNRAGRRFHRTELDEEWDALVVGLLRG